ncbi:MAG: pyridoxal phosphate-dependent aminotransferase [Bacteroidales bacterium]|jgi:cystathionine beta-lyase|nr:pyridoxal phosphate-dependent aminotransferase [Bacteroidales bacterium]MCI2135051.1 pyridoxal phosphate-dependent aminotransferase [Bacteroidales bacterium]MDY6378088.1 MalY/PatB family protein [Bacteroidales bacterium]MDY6384769.1 MalY/PatB family protein [Bacteroidales bacterium]MEE3430975.1 MalY/PatB family protein [Candidatus Cryptobacteroides sp.]
MMSKYNFDEMTVRRGTSCVKWDAPSPAGPISENVIPMWVADMDFKAAPAIQEAVRKRAEQGIFGYTHVPDSYFESSINWWQRRRGWHTQKDWYIPIDGIVPGMSIVIEAVTHYEVAGGKVVRKPNDGKGPNGELPKVIIQTPAYNCFFSAVRNQGCELVENPLIYDTEGDVPTWYLDFEDLEKKCADPMVKALLFCNPHNPCGRVWPKEDLLKVAEICRRHGVIVISDEIHCELEMPGCHFTPMASLSPEIQDNTIQMGSPSKSFNIAGLEISNIITSRKDWKMMIDKVINIYEHCDLNPFGIVALQAAYDEGEDWLKELNQYLWDNYLELVNLFEDEIPDVLVSKLEGTYLAWIDVRSVGLPTEEIEKSLIENEHVWINSGVMYGKEGFMRINIACPRTRLLAGIERIAQGLKRLSRK